jgi:hypothetical protein
MKLRAIFIVGCITVLVSAIGCTDSDSHDSASVHREAVADGSPERDARDLGDVRARADAAFAELAAPGARFESRIGPQPWPDDLPANWPIPEQGKVLASTAQKEGGRLLLVDLPGTPESAADFYRRELERNGFDLSRSPSNDSRHALVARCGRDEAVLTFLGRTNTTRVEILFLPVVPG